MKKYKLVFPVFLIIISQSFVDLDRNQFKIETQPNKKILYYSLNEIENIIIDDEDSIYTMNGKFKFYEEVATLNWYTYNLFYDKVLIGRYYLDSDFMNRQTEICVSNKKIKNKFSILKECINLIELDSNDLFPKIQNSIKKYPKEFYKSPEILNNKGFFLYKYKYYKEALLFLNRTIELFPNRTVVYLNIADCYWKLKDNEKAITNYKKYLSLMQSQNKDLKKVPKRVYERIK